MKTMIQFLFNNIKLCLGSKILGNFLFLSLFLCIIFIAEKKKRKHISCSLLHELASRNGALWCAGCCHTSTQREGGGPQRPAPALHSSLHAPDLHRLVHSTTVGFYDGHWCIILG